MSKTTSVPSALSVQPAVMGLGAITPFLPELENKRRREIYYRAPYRVKRDLRSASILKNGRVVFNVAGNQYRIVAWINYPYRVMYIRFVGTHEQYDVIDAQTI